VTEAQEQPGETQQPASSETSGNLDVIMDLDLALTVRFGRTQMTLGSLVGLAEGSEINLERSASDPVELLVNGKIIARGDVVAVEGNYAVRITDIVSPSERIANVGG
jgi:flagellar motor switch protein FliN/FliY